MTQLDARADEIERLSTYLVRRRREVSDVGIVERPMRARGRPLHFCELWWMWSRALQMDARALAVVRRNFRRETARVEREMARREERGYGIKDSDV